jgi:hypothetical protein
VAPGASHATQVRQRRCSQPARLRAQPKKKNHTNAKAMTTPSRARRRERNAHCARSRPAWPCWWDWPALHLGDDHSSAPPQIRSWLPIFTRPGENQISGHGSRRGADNSSWPWPAAKPSRQCGVPPIGRHRKRRRRVPDRSSPFERSPSMMPMLTQKPNQQPTTRKTRCIKRESPPPNKRGGKGYVPGPCGWAPVITRGWGGGTYRRGSGSDCATPVLPL